MAKIFGVELKNVKTFQGMEGEGIQGDIFIDNKKAGLYNDDGNGGESSIDFISAEKENLFNVSRVAYFSTHPVDSFKTGEPRLYIPKLNDQWVKDEKPEDFENRISTNGDAFVSEILALKDAEKTFKKFQKRTGNPILFNVEVSPFRKYYVSSPEDTEAEREKATNLVKKRCPKDTDTISIIAVYNQDSFVIKGEV